MKLIEKSTTRIANVSMYLMTEYGMDKSNDIAPDFFGGCAIVVDDIDYCIDEVLEWVHESGDEKHLAIIDDVLYTNYEL